MKLRLLLVAVVLCSGCLLAKRTPKDGEGSAVAANAAPSAGGAERKGEKLVCTRERVTGSHFKKKVCRYESDVKRERDTTQRQMRKGGVHVPGSPE